MSVNAGKRTIEYLQQNPHTAPEIAEWIFASYPQECQTGEARVADWDLPAEALSDLAAQV